MKCPHCGAADTRVVDSRPAEDGNVLRRRRLCDNCGERYTTHERVVSVPLFVVKGGGQREEFSPDKLKSGIVKACNKRPVSHEAIDKLVADVESALRGEPGNEVTAAHIGDLALERLYELDQVAYVRFASVYQRFDDVRRFAQLLDRMPRRNRRRPQGEGRPQSQNGAASGKEGAAPS